jgi:hypothetical protein
LHAVAPGNDWYLPAAHAAHAVRPSEPATLPCEQAAGAVAPLAHDEPAGQSAQSADDAPPVVPR